MRVRLRFDGSPGPEGPRFIEAEDMSGRSVSIGWWEKDQESDDWFLVVDLAEPKRARDTRVTVYPTRYRDPQQLPMFAHHD